MRKFIKWLLASICLLLLTANIAYAGINSSIGIQNYTTLEGSVNVVPIDTTYESGSNASRWAKGWFTDLDVSGVFTFGGAMGSDLDMNGYNINDVENIYAAGVYSNTASAGVLKFGGAFNTNNEELSWDFETTPNLVTVSSTTNVSTIDFSSIGLTAPTFGVDTISEYTSTHGVSIDGALVKDGGATFIAPISVDTINEYTATNGVVIDGWTLKDGGASIATGGTNTFNITNGTASLDVASGSAVDVNANLTVEAASTVNQDLTTDASVQFAGINNSDANITNVGSIALDTIAPDGTNIDVNISAGTLNIGDGTYAFGHSPNVGIEGILEVDGVGYFDSTTQFTGTATHNGAAVFNSLTRIADVAGLYFGNSDDAIIKYTTAQTPDGLILGVGAENNSLIISEIADIAVDFAHALQINPTVFIHSADATDVDDWISFSHNQTNGVIDSGNGGIQFNSPIIVGTTEYTADAGAVIGWNMPVSATPTAGDEMSLTFDIDQTDHFKIYSEADSSGGIQNSYIKSFYDFVIGTAAAGVDYTLTFDGESDDGVITYMEDENNFSLGDTGLSTTGAIQATTFSDGTYTVAAGEFTGVASITDGTSSWSGNDLSGFDAISASSLAIGTSSVDLSSIVDLTSTTKGMLPPRMTTTQRNAISSPVEGLFVYNTTLNSLDYYDGGSWRSAGSVDTDYAGMYFDNNGTAQTIETANTPIAVRNTTEGSLNNWTRVAGSTGAITAYADYGGTVAGTVKATDAGHGLSTGDIISIRGTTNYNGIFQITVIDSDNFYFTDTWVADDGASDWDSPDYLLAGAGADGDYKLIYNVSFSVGGAAADNILFTPYVNTTVQSNAISQRYVANNDVGNATGLGIVTIAENDRVYMTVQSDGTDDPTLKYGNILLTRL